MFCCLVKGVMTRGTPRWMPNALTLWRSSWHPLIVPIQVNLFPCKSGTSPTFWLEQLWRRRKCQNQVQYWKTRDRVDSGDPMCFPNAEAEDTENREARSVGYSQPLGIHKLGSKQETCPPLVPSPEPALVGTTPPRGTACWPWWNLTVRTEVLREHLSQEVVPGPWGTLDSHPRESYDLLVHYIYFVSY